MLSLLARLIIAAPKRVLAAVLLITVVAAAFGATVTEHLGAAGFQDPSSPSARGMKVLTTKFGQGDMDLTLVLHAPGSVQDPAAAAAGRNLVSLKYACGQQTRHATPNRASPRVAFSGVPDLTTGHTTVYSTAIRQWMGGFLRKRNFYGVVAVVRHCHVDDRR